VSKRKLCWLDGRLARPGADSVGRYLPAADVGAGKPVDPFLLRSEPPRSGRTETSLTVSSGLLRSTGLTGQPSFDQAKATVCSLIKRLSFINSMLA